MTIRRSLIWFIIGVIWVFAAFAIVYEREQLALQMDRLAAVAWQFEARRPTPA
jgi:hypothetical protein